MRFSVSTAQVFPHEPSLRVPLLVRGPFKLRDQDGNEIDVGRKTVALCRCGKSRIRPFCDGTHALVRFRAPSGAERGREAGAAARPADGRC